MNSLVERTSNIHIESESNNVTKATTRSEKRTNTVRSNKTTNAKSQKTLETKTIHRDEARNRIIESLKSENSEDISLLIDEFGKTNAQRIIIDSYDSMTNEERIIFLQSIKRHQKRSLEIDAENIRLIHSLILLVRSCIDYHKENRDYPKILIDIGNCWHDSYKDITLPSIRDHFSELFEYWYTLSMPKYKKFGQTSLEHLLVYATHSISAMHRLELLLKANILENLNCDGTAALTINQRIQNIMMEDKFYSSEVGRRIIVFVLQKETSVENGAQNLFRQLARVATRSNQVTNVGLVVYQWWKATLDAEGSNENNSDMAEVYISQRRQDVEFFLVQKLIERAIVCTKPVNGILFADVALKTLKAALIRHKSLVLVDSLIYRCTNPILWRRLDSPNCDLRYHAIQFFLTFFPIRDPDSSSLNRAENFDDQKRLLQAMLDDADERVRLLATRSLMDFVTRYWSNLFSDHFISNVLKNVFKIRACENYLPVRLLAYESIEQMITEKPATLLTVEKLLPMLIDTGIDDANEKIRFISTQILIKFKELSIDNRKRWTNILSLDRLLGRIAVDKSARIAEALIQVLGQTIINFNLAAEQRAHRLFAISKRNRPAVWKIARHMYDVQLKKTDKMETINLIVEHIRMLLMAAYQMLKEMVDLEKNKTDDFEQMISLKEESVLILVEVSLITTTSLLKPMEALKNTTAHKTEIVKLYVKLNKFIQMVTEECSRLQGFYHSLLDTVYTLGTVLPNDDQCKNAQAIFKTCLENILNGKENDKNNESEQDLLMRQLDVLTSASWQIDDVLRTIIEWFQQSIIYFVEITTPNQLSGQMPVCKKKRRNISGDHRHYLRNLQLGREYLSFIMRQPKTRLLLLQKQVFMLNIIDALMPIQQIIKNIILSTDRHDGLDNEVIRSACEVLRFTIIMLADSDRKFRQNCLAKVTELVQFLDDTLFDAINFKLIGLNSECVKIVYAAATTIINIICDGVSTLALINPVIYEDKVQDADLKLHSLKLMRNSIITLVKMLDIKDVPLFLNNCNRDVQLATQFWVCVPETFVHLCAIASNSLQIELGLPDDVNIHQSDVSEESLRYDDSAYQIRSMMSALTKLICRFDDDYEATRRSISLRFSMDTNDEDDDDDSNRVRRQREVPNQPPTPLPIPTDEKDILEIIQLKCCVSLRLIFNQCRILLKNLGGNLVSWCDGNSKLAMKVGLSLHVQDLYDSLITTMVRSLAKNNAHIDACEDPTIDTFECSPTITLVAKMMCAKSVAFGDGLSYRLMQRVERNEENDACPFATNIFYLAAAIQLLLIWKKHGSKDVDLMRGRIAAQSLLRKDGYKNDLEKDAYQQLVALIEAKLV